MSTKGVLSRYNSIHRLIKNKSTGTPSQLALKLGICESMVFNIREMKLEGAPIAYDKVTQTYYYTLDGEFSCTFGWEVN